MASVWQCRTPDEARALLSGEVDGYVYQRDGHPAADQLAEKLRRLHGAEAAMVTSCGMSALAAVVLSQLLPGDSIVASRHLYGRSLDLLSGEADRLGVETTTVDTTDLDATAAAINQRTRLLVVETISNPLLRVADIQAVAEIAHNAGVRLLVDNTFASPVVCRPLEHGADLVVESVSKVIGGHSDVMLGFVAAPRDIVGSMQRTVSVYGLASPPLDCWLALRGLSTLHLRARRAAENALAAAEFLGGHEKVAGVQYPGLASHPDHELAARQFGGLFGSVVTFHLRGGETAVTRFIEVSEIPFCPSLGEVSTTLSHPASTSHRQLDEAGLTAVGITAGTIRLSLGVESAESILGRLHAGLAAV